MTTTTPRQAVDALRSRPELPHGDDERFAAYGGATNRVGASLYALEHGLVTPE